MIRITVLLFIGASLAGCASISYPLPKCDGYSRRPLNRSMWQWEDEKQTQQPKTQANRTTADPTTTNVITPYVEEEARSRPAAFEHFDIAGSYRPCEEQ